MRYLEIAAERKRGPEWTALRDVEKYDKSGVEVYDMTNLPIKGYEDNTFDGIYSEHFIEHIFKYQGLNYLKECLRLLKPGGIVRTVWPPYDFVEKLISEEKLSLAEDFFVKQYHSRYVTRHKFAPAGNEHRGKREQCALGLLYQNGEHRYLWGIQEIIKVHEDLGFVDVKQMPYGKSDLTVFNQIDTRCRIRAAHSAIIEARKP